MPGAGTASACWRPQKLIAALGAHFHNRTGVSGGADSPVAAAGRRTTSASSRKRRTNAVGRMSVAQLKYGTEYHDQAITKSLHRAAGRRDSLAFRTPDRRRGNPAWDHCTAGAWPVASHAEQPRCGTAPAMWVTDLGRGTCATTRELVIQVCRRWKSTLRSSPRWCSSQPDGMTQCRDRREDVCQLPCISTWSR